MVESRGLDFSLVVFTKLPIIVVINRDAHDGETTFIKMCRTKS